MASEAVNFKSFVTAIGKRMSSTTPIPYNILKKLITCSNTNESRAISIKEACNICKQILNNLDIATNEYITEIAQKDSLAILSKNNAITILDRYISIYNWIDIIYTKDIGMLKSDTNYKVIIADETTSATVSVTLVGGGSGGKGAYGCDGDKNASYTIRVYGGAPGCDSQLYISYPNGTQTSLFAPGGAQTNMTSLKVGGNPTNNAAGTTGGNGKQTSSNVTFRDGSTILGIKGNGGQGSGGVSVNAGGATGGKTFTNQTKSVTPYWCHGYGKTNEWSGDDLTFGGGGGQGGGNTASIYSGGDIRRQKGNNSHSGPTAATVVASTNAGTDDGKLGTVVIGGRGGYYSGSNWGTPQPSQEELGRTGAGIGGYGGQRRFVTDQATSSNGGNGGNSGRITGISGKYIYFIEWEYPTSNIPGGGAGFVPD